MCELHRTNPTFEEKHGEQWNYWVGYNPKLAIFVWARGWNAGDTMEHQNTKVIKCQVLRDLFP